MPNARIRHADHDMLKLVALDEEDLAVISAHVQDAVMKVGDLDYAKASQAVRR